MPAILPDKTLSILLKDVIFKGFIVVYDSQSPTRNKEAAIKKMLEAGDFIAHHGVDMSQELFDNLGNRYTELILTQRTISTRWRDFFTSPVKTYIAARDFKAGADLFLADAMTASAQADYNASTELREEKKARKVALEANAAQPVPVPQDAAIVPVNPVNVTTPELTAPGPLHTDFNIGSNRAYIQLEELEMKVPLDRRTRLNFDGEVFTATFRPSGLTTTSHSAPDDRCVGAVKRTASVFTATGTARIVPQPDHNADASSGHSSQDSDEEVPTPYKLEWLDGPFVTALTELEDETMVVETRSVSDSGLSSD
ncbi:hypothetical protein V8D89_013139 [Ganoderma adspersum]